MTERGEGSSSVVIGETRKLPAEHLPPMDIPVVDLSKLTPATRTEVLQKLNSQACTCGCDLTVARCRVDDPTCGVSLPLARQIVQRIAGQS